MTDFPLRSLPLPRHAGPKRGRFLEAPMASKGGCHKAMIFICGRLGFSPALLHLLLHMRCHLVGNFSALGFNNLALDNDCTSRFVENDLPCGGKILSRTLSIRVPQFQEYVSQPSFRRKVLWTSFPHSAASPIQAKCVELGKPNA